MMDFQGKTLRSSLLLTSPWRFAACRPSQQPLVLRTRFQAGGTTSVFGRIVFSDGSMDLLPASEQSREERRPPPPGFKVKASFPFSVHLCTSAHPKDEHDISHHQSYHGARGFLETCLCKLVVLVPRAPSTWLVVGLILARYFEPNWVRNPTLALDSRLD